METQEEHALLNTIHFDTVVGMGGDRTVHVDVAMARRLPRTAALQRCIIRVVCTIMATHRLSSLPDHNHRFSAFQAVSAYTNAGLSLQDQSMVPFQRAYLMIFIMIFLILAGNTAFVSSPASSTGCWAHLVSLAYIVSYFYRCPVNRAYSLYPVFAQLAVCHVRDLLH